jgi:D-3-phosphoglycerate dehydrogenase / 2-oxoglutarate reductase
MTHKHLIIDFDSTLIEVEALDELAALALADRPGGVEIAAEIARITDLGMEGKLPIDESLRRRLTLLDARRADVETLATALKGRITPSFRTNAAFFERNRERIYVISNGFKDYIVPVVKELSIDGAHVFANTFVYDVDGRIVGYDHQNPLAQRGGKSKQLLALNLSGEIYVIGDGYTDWQMTETGRVTKFIAYAGNVDRPTVTAKTDCVVDNFDEFISLGYFDD